MDQNEAIVTVLTLAVCAATLLSLVRMWLKSRQTVAASTVAQFENRLARVEVALDDVTSQLGQMTEAQQLLTKVLTEKQHALP
jgi:hypothetical protein